MATAILLGTFLVLLTLFIHQAALTFLARCMPICDGRSQPWLYLLMLGIFAAHLVEILLYALGYYVAATVFDLGYLEGERAAGFLGHFYASAVFYTSLGLGDVLPNGHLRFVTGVEALNGLLLIAWSASFLFAAMGRFWHCLAGASTASREAERIGSDRTIDER